MKFILRKADDVWNVTPASGQFEGVVVAQVEAATLSNAVFEGKTITASIKAVWGVSILCEEIYSDVPTLKALRINERFDDICRDKVYVNIEGFLDFTNRILRGARRMRINGNSMYSEGAFN